MQRSDCRQSCCEACEFTILILETIVRKDLTDVTVVLDRSGSMVSCREEAENGLNHFIEEQKKQPGECLFSLVQFDNEYEFVHKGEKISDIPKFTLVPRGMTALLDAVGRAIGETGNRLSAMKESDRPGLVVFVIVTDGGENSSHEFNKKQVRDMIERQKSEYSWKFTFLGANQDAFAEASALGIDLSAIAGYSTTSSKKAFSGASGNVTRMRSAAIQGQSIQCSYTPEELVAMS